MMIRCLILMLSLVMGAVLTPNPAMAQHEKANRLVDQVSELRVEIKRLDLARQAVLQVKNQQDAQLRALSAKITQKKDERAQSKAQLLPSFELNRLLQQSQSLSASLTSLNREVKALNQVRNERSRRLAVLVDAWIKHVETSLAEAPAAQKKTLWQTLSRLHQERRQLQQSMTKTPDTGLLERSDLLASEDPEELGERLDAVRDEQDRLRKHLGRLQKRIDQRRNARRLEREMTDFLDDQDLFGERSRLLVLNQTDPQNAGKDTQDRDDLIGEGNETTTPPGGYWDGSGDPNLSNDALPGDESSITSTPDTPQVSAPHDLPIGVDTPEPNSTEAPVHLSMKQLQKQRLALEEKLKQLQQLNDRLQEKMESLTP